jgi:hypothetical protein
MNRERERERERELRERDGRSGWVSCRVTGYGSGDRSGECLILTLILEREKVMTPFRERKGGGFSFQGFRERV